MTGIQAAHRFEFRPRAGQDEAYTAIRGARPGAPAGYERQEIKSPTWPPPWETHDPKQPI